MLSKKWIKNYRRHHLAVYVREYCQMLMPQRAVATDRCARTGFCNLPISMKKNSVIRLFHVVGVAGLQGSTVLFGAKIPRVGTHERDAWAIFSVQCVKRCTGGNTRVPRHRYVRKPKTTPRHNGSSSRKTAFTPGGLLCCDDCWGTAAILLTSPVI